MVYLHDKVKAYAGFAIVALAVLVIIDRAFTVDIVPDDTEKLFWASIVPILVGLGGAYYTREGKSSTK